MPTAHHGAAHRSPFVALAAVLLTIPAVVGTSAARASSPADHATPSVRGPSLLGRAVLPFYTFAGGPASGAYVVPGTGVPGSGVVNGVAFPLPGQPVEGFSAIVAGKRTGEYLAMADNGFGSKLNSRDFLIRAYAVRPQLKTARGGSGEVRVGEFISFRDPDHRLSFELVNNTGSRLLTGADIDPESLQRGRNGDLWVGDEFGPWILHFNGHGKLLEAPYEVPGIRSPNNPFLGGAARHATQQPRLRGHGDQPGRQVPVRRPRRRHRCRGRPAGPQRLRVQRRATRVHGSRPPLPHRGTGQPAVGHVGDLGWSCL